MAADNLTLIASLPKNATTVTTLARELASIITADLEPMPDAATLAALRAGLARQVVAVGPAVAAAALSRMKTAPGPVGIDARRARFGGVAAALASDLATAKETA